MVSSAALGQFKSTVPAKRVNEKRKKRREEGDKITRQGQMWHRGAISGWIVLDGIRDPDSGWGGVRYRAPYEGKGEKGGEKKRRQWQ